MTKAEAIKRADLLRPNVIPLYQKIAWLEELEGEFAECMETEPPVPTDMDSYDKENDTEELLMPFPKEEVYELFLCAKIDNAHEETELYTNDMLVANQAISEAKRWWRRNNRPSRNGCLRRVYR